jgi:hypothetical protein
MALERCAGCDRLVSTSESVCSLCGTSMRQVNRSSLDQSQRGPLNEIKRGCLNEIGRVILHSGFKGVRWILSLIVGLVIAYFVLRFVAGITHR